MAEDMQGTTVEARGAQLRLLLSLLDEELQAGDVSVGINTVVQLVVHGEHGGNWVVVLRDGVGCVRMLEHGGGVEVGEVGCKVETDVGTIVKIANGEMKPAMAVIRGRVRYSGSIAAFKGLQEPLQRAGTRTLERIGPEGLGAHLESLIAERRAASKAKDEEEWEQLRFILDSSHPEWENNALRCKICLARFTFFRREHHCRKCGSAICGTCSSHEIKGFRVCTGCWQSHVAERSRTALPQSPRQADSLAISEVEAEAPTLLPFERLISHVKAMQGKSIGAAIEGTTMSILTSTRQLMLRVRSLEESIQQEKENSLWNRFSNLALWILPKLISFGALTLSWEHVLHGFASSAPPERPAATLMAFGLLGFSWRKPKVFTSSLIAASLRFSGNSFFSGFSSSVLGGSVIATAKLLMSKTGWTVFLGGALEVRPVFGFCCFILSAILSLGIHFFGRLLRIYATAGFIIMTYYSIYLILARGMGMSIARLTRIYEQLDLVMAPFACSQILALRSVFVKFGQYIGSRADIIPPLWGKVLAKLQDDMPADRLQHVEACIKSEFGHLVDEIFESFDYIPMASASIAQVHRAVIKPNTCSTGRLDAEGNPVFLQTELEVAVKVQHEGIEEIMKSDVVAFRRIIHFIAWLNPRFEVAKTLLRAWEKEMLKELDFTIEADNLLRVRRNMRKAGLLVDDDHDYADKTCVGSQVLVPKPIHAFIRKRAFCMTFLHGFKITDTEQLALFNVDKSALVKRVVHAYSTQIYVDGLANVDPHAGNLMVSISDDGTARPVLLDFGMVVTLSDKQRLGYCKLVNAISNMSISELSNAVAEVGYKNSQSDKHPERDLEFFAFLLRDTGDRKSQRQSTKKFRQRRKAQRKADLENDPNKQGRFFASFPDSLIFLFRVLGLIRGLCTTLDAPISYLDIMGNYAKLGLAYSQIDDLDEEEVIVSPSLAALSTNSMLLKEKAPLKPVEAALAPKVRKILKEAMESAMEDFTSLGDEGFAVDGFLGAQVCISIAGRNVAKTEHGVRTQLGPNRVKSSTLIPLLDITRLLPVIIVLRLADEGRLRFRDSIRQHWEEFYHPTLTVGEALSYSVKSEDRIGAETTPNNLCDFKSLMKRLETDPVEDDETRNEVACKYQVFTLGYILAGLLEKILRKPIDQIVAQELEDLYGIDMCMSIAMCGSQLEASRLSRGAEVVNGFAKMVRGVIMGGGALPASLSLEEKTETSAGVEENQEDSRPLQFEASSESDLSEEHIQQEKQVLHRTKAIFPSETLSSAEEENFGISDEPTQNAKVSSHPANGIEEEETGGLLPDNEIEEEETGGLLPDGVVLPPGVMIDPCCVNSMAVRKSTIPSFGGFGTAQALTELVHAFLFKRSSKILIRTLCKSPRRSGSSPLFGKMNFTYGFQAHQFPDTGLHLLMMHGFGGNLIAVIPEKQIVVSVLVNCLTLDRSVARDILNLVLRDLKVSATPNPSQPLFDGMF